MYTPIGEMSTFAYLAITQIKNNPVMHMYNFSEIALSRFTISLQCRFMRSSVEMDCLMQYRMEDLGIQDPLGLHRFDYLWSGVRHFFEEAKVV